MNFKEELLKLLASDSEVAEAFASLVTDQVAELLPSALEGAVEGLTESFNQQLEEFRANTETDNGDTSVSEDGDSPMAARLKRLEAELQEQRDKVAKAEADRLETDKNARISERYQAAFDAATGGRALHRDFIYGVIKQQLGNLKEQDGEFYTDKGKTLTEYVTEFFNTDVGKHFIDAGSVYGLSSAFRGGETEAPVKAGINTAPTDDLASAFANF